ncbi:hypothetical protein [Nocardia sp. NPDC059239]|uniref:hypothetical protein n=1 Tax=unclassified Nocardia TaxID=2637762 RepID=UPI0036875A55
MALPTEPGIYRDARGDLWVLHMTGRWQHVERRLSDGRFWPVRDYEPVSAETLESLSHEPDVDVIPLTWVDIIPDGMDSDQ